MIVGQTDDLAQHSAIVWAGGATAWATLQAKSDGSSRQTGICPRLGIAVDHGSVAELGSANARRRWSGAPTRALTALLPVDHAHRQTG